VRDDAMILNPKPCVPITACGCVDDDGNAHAGYHIVVGFCDKSLSIFSKYSMEIGQLQLFERAME
jgi:hypothetical protein